MKSLQEIEKEWLDAQNEAVKARLEYLESHDRWEIANRKQENLWDRYIDALRFEKTVNRIRNLE
jgi:hypothetical protein